MDEVQKKVLSRLEGLCSRQECCSKDILAKAQKALAAREGYIAAPGAAEEILSSLIENGYVDDSRYAAAFAREKAAITGWGPLKIKMALAAKGISREIASTALLEIEPERSDAKLRKVLETKWRTLADDPQGKLKLIRFALSRGYEYDTIRPLIDEITKD